MDWTYIKYKDGFQFVPVTFPLNKPDGILIENLKLSQLIEYINKKNIKKAFIQGFSSFDFIANCNIIEHLSIEFSLPFIAYKDGIQNSKNIHYTYDLSPLYQLKHLKSITFIDSDQIGICKKYCIDISQFKEIEEYCGEYASAINLYDAVTLKTLVLNKYREHDLRKLCNLKNLDTIQLTFSSIQTLDGIEAFNELQCLYLYRNRSLCDINSLSNVKTLKALRIENCSQIKDFSVLGKLKNLELLEISGSNDLVDLYFLNTMKNLKTFIFNINVLDGDLSPCLDLSYVYCEKNRKHYNLKDKDLPKGVFIKGNENIDEWRRLE